MPYSRRRSSSRRSGHGRLVLAQCILFFIGILATFVGAVGMRDAQQEVVYLLDAPSSQIEPGVEIPKDELREQALQEMTRRVRLAYGVDVGLGLLFVACALLVHRLPVIATVTGLTLYLGSLAMLASVDIVLLSRGLFVRILIVIALSAAVTSAIRTERRRKARRRRHEEEDNDSGDVR